MNLVSGALQLHSKSVLISGSISQTADPNLTERARVFVRLLTREILDAGGRLVVYAAGEPLDDAGRPVIFDWEIIREVDQILAESLTGPRLIIVTSERNRQEKMSAAQRQLLGRLALRKVADIVILPDDVVTGGNIGDEQTERADAMVAIGGGKGVTDRARKLMKSGIPVLPMDIKIGALSEDGQGAVGLHGQFVADPSRFLTHTGPAAVNAMFGMSLQEPIQSEQAIAAATVTLIAAELDAQLQSAPTDVLVLTALPIELEAAQLAFGITAGTPPKRTTSGINFWRSQQRREDGKIATIDIACFAGAGNTGSATVTATLLIEQKPRQVIMMGIAAGMRDKCRLGQVVIGERVVFYEGAAMIDGGKVEARPESYLLVGHVSQDVAAYLAAKSDLRTRLDGAWASLGLAIPTDVKIGPVADTPLPDLTTIASGEQLLRDAVRFAELRQLHGKIEVAEMEAAGVCSACRQHGVPALVIRGISDFGDKKKDSRFHEIAAKAAALVADDIVRFGLRL